jgi:Formate/nitrite transporter
LWAIVIAGNLAGALGFATLLSHVPVFSPEWQRAFDTVAAQATGGEALSNFVRAIYAGWFIALMVWLLPAAESAAMFIILLLTYVVASAGLTHVVAGSVEAFYAAETGAERERRAPALPVAGLRGQFAGRSDVCGAAELRPSRRGRRPARTRARQRAGVIALKCLPAAPVS